MENPYMFTVFMLRNQMYDKSKQRCKTRTNYYNIHINNVIYRVTL